MGRGGQASSFGGGTGFQLRGWDKLPASGVGQASSLSSAAKSPAPAGQGYVKCKHAHVPAAEVAVLPPPFGGYTETAMPTYEYRCDGCEHAFEEYQSITADPLKKCPGCGKKKLRRLIGTGGGLIFKGSGFYLTDYRSESYRKAAEAESKVASAAPPTAAPAGTSAAEGTKATGGATTDKPATTESARSAAKAEKPAKQPAARKKRS